MNSSISVFRSVEGKVIGLLLLCFLGLEVFFANTASHFSQDVAKIDKLGSLSQELASAPPPRILFLGNSILLAGIEPDLFASLSETTTASGPPSVFMAHPDSSNIVIWDYLLNRYFLSEGAFPEEVVIVTGRTHLEDQYANPVDLGGYYVDQSDTARYLAGDARGFDDACHFFLGRYSETFRMRKRVSPRVYDALMPFFQENWIHLHSPRARLATDDSEPLPLPKESSVTTTHLNAVIERLHRNQIQLTVVKAPAITPYRLDPVVQSTLVSNEIQIIDISDQPGITAEHFADSDHLNSAGKILFTRALADAMNRR